VAPPAERQGRGGCIGTPGDVSPAHRRRVGVAATGGTHPTHVLEGLAASSSRLQARLRFPTRTSPGRCGASPSRPDPPALPPGRGPSGRGRGPQARGPPSMHDSGSAPHAASHRGATAHAVLRTVDPLRVAAIGRTAGSAGPVRPSATSAAPVVARQRRAGAVGSATSAVTGRHGAGSGGGHGPWPSRGLRSLMGPTSGRQVRGWCPVVDRSTPHAGPGVRLAPTVAAWCATRCGGRLGKRVGASARVSPTGSSGWHLVSRITTSVIVASGPSSSQTPSGPVSFLGQASSWGDQHGRRVFSPQGEVAPQICMLSISSRVPSIIC
jgi:hypothetical protein